MTNKYAKFSKASEIMYLIIAGICLIESASRFFTGQTKLGFMFLVGVAFGVSMSLTRRRMRLKMSDKNNPK